MTKINEKHKARSYKMFDCCLHVNCQVLVVHICKSWNTHSPQFESSTDAKNKDTFECFGAKYFQEIAASQGFAFLGRGDVEWVKYWQMPSPKTSLFTTIPM